MWFSVLFIGLGAALGATTRWLLGNGLNALLPALPPGTLTANWLGAYLIGIAVALSALFPQWPAEWRLFVITGFLGGLTTFSTFSAEVTTQLQNGRFGWAVAAIALHVGGSLLLTTAGMATVWLLQRR